MEIPNVEIYSQPKGTASSVVVSNTSDYLGKKVHVHEEKINSAGIWSHISIDGLEVGFVLKSALSVEQVTATRTIDEIVRIAGEEYPLTTKPYGTEGYETAKDVSVLLDSVLIAIEEVDTVRGTFVHLYLDNQELGWINKNALTEAYFNIISEKTNQFVGKVSSADYDLYAAPQYSEGAEIIAVGSALNGSEVKATKEATTEKGTFTYVTVQGKT